MNVAQQHRGPDDSGIWTDTTRAGDFVALGSRRLAILDLSPSGHMPMISEDGRFVLVYNGEVYNYLELRSDLQRDGIQFKSSGDTEVILALYRKYGYECIQYMRGMFAFAVWDRRDNELFLVRDHFGIKPLYYIHQNGRLAFASEIKSMLHLPDFSVEIDQHALQQYLSLLWVPDPDCLFQGVFKLPAGHYAIYKNGALTTRQYWDLEFPDAGHLYPDNYDDLALSLRDRMSRNVKEQMISDVPLGAFLSAGLDSSALVACMAEHSPDPIKTFTIAFPRDKTVGEVHLDDPMVARRTAAHLGCEHRNIVVEPDVVDLLPKLVYHSDEPIADPAIVMSYLVCKAAADNATVLLSGIGGDELFAGYRKHRAHYMLKAYRRLPKLIRRGLLNPLANNLPALRGSRLKGYARLARKFARSGELSAEDSFLMHSIYLDSAERAWLCNDDIWEKVSDFDPLVTHRGFLTRSKDWDFLNRMLYVDSKLFMVSLNLTYNDKMSMANSIEVRVPYLDPALAEWVARNISPENKLRGKVGKRILRSAFQRDLPPEIFRQKKAGFGAPIDYWLAEDLQEMIRDLLSEDRIQSRGLFKPESVAGLVQDQFSGRRDRSFQVWQLLTLELWFQNFIDA